MFKNVPNHLKRLKSLRNILFGFGLLLSFILVSPPEVKAQNFDLTTLNFKNFPGVSNGTSLQFGQDGRLYVTQLKGQVKIYTINRLGQTSYEVTAYEEILTVKNIPNHNDVGGFVTRNSRESTGLVVGGTANNPVIYVSSSDEEMGGPSGDKNLDTNSGVITQITWNGSSWKTIDLVRGLPRSEENHATNGMELVNIQGTNFLIVCSGGFTNAGAPSNNFAYITEYALSGAVLAVNVDALNALPTLIDATSGRQYKYDLPTLDDPTRANVNGIYNPNNAGYNGIDIGDPWGGNDGLNQAILKSTGLVQMFSSGYRNAYDLVITKDGKVYVTDNGANGGWGGLPKGEGNNASLVTNEYEPSEPGSSSSINNERVDNEDHLNYVTSNIQSYVFGSVYGGHATPIRANPGKSYNLGAPFPFSPGGAGLYTKLSPNSVVPKNGDINTQDVFRTKILTPIAPGQPGFDEYARTSLPANWPPAKFANPAEADWRGAKVNNPDGPQDILLTTWATNTNGIDEYTASNFGGAMKGNLIAGKSDGSLHRVILNPNGSLNTLEQSKFSTQGGNPLGITCNGDDTVFPGTIWVATFDSRIVILEPNDFVICVLLGEAGYNALEDNDGDGFINQDEIDNGTDLCSGASQPNDYDGDKISNLNDLDDDGDGINDNLDLFQLDRGIASELPIDNELFSDQLDNQEKVLGYLGLGITGLMNNGAANPNYLDWFDKTDQGPNPNDILGGAVGAITVNMTGGTALGNANTQEKGYQFGVNVSTNTGEFTVESKLINFSDPFQLYQSSAGSELGIFIGTGSQSDYVKLVLTQAGLTMLSEQGNVVGTPIKTNISVANRPSSLALFFKINPTTGLAQAFYRLNDKAIQVLGSLTVRGALLNAIQQANIPMAVGIIGSTFNATTEVQGTWDYFKVTGGNPYMSQQIPNFNKFIEDEAILFNLNDYFGDDTGTAGLTYIIEENTDNLVSVNILSNILTVNIPSEAANTSITVRATDGDGLFIEQIFSVNILNKLVNYTWNLRNEAQNYTGRHECSFVQAGDKFYLIGGRENAKTPDIYNYTNNTWTTGALAPVELNHYQALEYQGLIWAIGSFSTNSFPNEAPATHVYMYDPANNVWIQGAEIPVARRRGSAGLVMYNDKFYVVGGNTIGHNGGYVGWFDEFDPATGVWTALPNAPRARDHFHATVLDGKLYAVGGRLSGGVGGVFAPLVPEVDVYDFTTQTWSQVANLPTPRAAAVVATFQNQVFVAGGEIASSTVALNVAEAFDPTTGTWETKTPLLNERHGTQAIVSGGGVFVAAGSPNKGGGTQKNMEYYGENTPTGTPSVASVLEHPSKVGFYTKTIQTIALSNTTGNQAIFIKSIALGGTQSGSFTILNGQFSNFIIPAGGTHNLQVELVTTEPNQIASIDIIYGANAVANMVLSNSEIIFNGLPTFTSFPGTQVNVEGDIINLPVTADDGNGGIQTLTYNATNLPPGVSINPSTGLISGTLDAGTGNGVDGAFVENGGLLVIEMESASSLVGSWKNASTYSTTFSPNVNSPGSASGADFIIWQGNQSLNATGNGLLAYPIEINTPGTYRFQWRNQVGNGTNTTDHNDTWLKIEADAFYGQKGSNGTIVCPNGFNPTTNDCIGNPPAGVSSGGWFKVYSSGANNWSWVSNTSDNDAHQIYARFDTPGSYNILISARSSSHAIDRMVLSKTDYSGNPQSLSLAESPRNQSVGASEGSPYQVTVTATDDGVPAAAVSNTFTWIVNAVTGIDCSGFVVSNFTFTNPTCAGNNGTITLNTTGLAGASYSWSHNASLNSPSITGLASGTYTVTVTSSDGNCSTQRSVTLAPATGCGVTNIESVWLEAECAILGSKWIAQASNTASSGKYVVVPNNGTNINQGINDIENNEIIRFEFTANAANYKLFTRLYSPSGNDNSFYYRVNGGAWILWFLMDIGNLRWELPPTSQFTLQAGLNVIEFALREDGTGLDKIYLTKNLSTSLGSIVGFGATASNCVVNPCSGFVVSNFTSTNPTCAGNNGTITLNTTGLAGASYSWSHNASLNSPSITGLAAGTYTVTVTSSDGNCSTQRSVTLAPATGCGVTNIESVWLEAECAILGSKWIAQASNTASSGKYVVVPNNGTNINQGINDIENNEIIRFEFTANAANYKLFTRLYSPSGNDNSFYYRVNGGAWILWFLMDIGNLRWELPPTSQFTLQAGLNVIEFALREDGTGLDKIYLTKNLSAGLGSITGFGATASNCVVNPCSGFVVSNFTFTNPTCAGNNGTITLNTTGLAGASYSWSHNASLNSPSITGLASGTYTVTVTSLDGNCSTQRSVTLAPATGCGGGGYQVYLEAECASVGNTWSVKNNSLASSGKYVEANLNALFGGLFTAPPATSANRVEFNFVVPSTGSYSIYSRVLTPSYTDDSFYISIDGGSPQTWNGLHNPSESGFRWLKVLNQNYTLTAGTHTISFYYRENGTGLDKIYITDQSDVPTGFGATASNCALSRSSNAQAAEVGVSEEEEEVKASVTSVYPNPLVGNDLNLTFNQELSETLQYRVYDNWGRIVTQGSIEVKGDKAKISFRGTNLVNSNLMLIIEGETLSQQRLRFIKSE